MVTTPHPPRKFVHLRSILSKTTCHEKKKKTFIFLCPFALCISVCLLPPHTPGTSCAVECIALSAGDVWQWFAGRWKQETRTCGESNGGLWGGSSWEASYDKSASVKHTSVAKTSDAVFNLRCLDTGALEHRGGLKKKKRKKKHATCFVLVAFMGWELKVDAQSRDFSRWHVGGSGRRRRRESICGKTLANANSIHLQYL